MRKKLILLAVVIMMLFVAASAQAVTWGQPDGNAHPYVGLLIFDDETGPAWRCTGTLISPRVVLTAGHCTEGAVAARIWFDQNVDLNPEYPFPGRTSVEGTPIMHPQYGGFPATYDIGVVILDKPVRMATYGQLPSQGFLETINSRNNTFTVVGYGMQGYINPVNSSDRIRYAGNVRLIELNSTFNGDGQSAKFTNNPGSTSGGSCYGDSGGPVFYGNTNVVVAVVSWGITPCIGVDYQFRTDTAVAQDFVNQYLR